MIDEIDRQILNILQQNARTSNAEIARQVGMAPSAVLERIRKLETRGVIRGYEARIDPEALGLNLLAFVVRPRRRHRQRADGRVAGPDPGGAGGASHRGRGLLSGQGPGPRREDAWARLLRERFAGSGTVRSTRTTVVLETLRESAQLPVGAGTVADPVKSIEPVEKEEEVLL